MYRLITYHPQNYIDEYQDELFMMTGKKYSLSSIYRQIRRCGYSCQKIYIRAAEIDQMERIDFKLRLHNLCIRPETKNPIHMTEHFLFGSVHRKKHNFYRQYS